MLNTNQQAAFENYIQDGGGYVGIHSAADTEYDWPFYGNLVGAYFKTHPAIQEATIKVADKNHPSTKHLPDRWSRTDEWYDYQTNPRGDVHVLATLDETTYDGATMGSDHPITWCQDFGGGRSFYTGLGHTKESYGEPAFQKQLLGGIRWAAGDMAGDCDATVEGRYQKVTLNDFPIEADGHRAAAAGPRPDDRAQGPRDAARPEDRSEHGRRQARRLPARRGRRPEHRASTRTSSRTSGSTSTTRCRPGTRRSTTRRRPTSTRATRRSTARRRTSRSSEGPCACRASRCRATRSTSTPSSGSSTCRSTAGICCHVGGHIDFDSQGNLYLSTGDDTNPFESDGYCADRRAAEPQPGASTPSARRPTRTTCAARSCGSSRRTAAATRSRPATCSRRARRRPSPRST